MYIDDDIIYHSIKNLSSKNPVDLHTYIRRLKIQHPKKKPGHVVNKLRNDKIIHVDISIQPESVYLLDKKFLRKYKRKLFFIEFNAWTSFFRNIIWIIVSVSSICL